MHLPPLLLSDLTTKELEEEYFRSKFRKIDYALRTGTTCFAALVERTVDEIDAMTIGGFRAYYKEFPIRKTATASVASVTSVTSVASVSSSVRPSAEQIAAQRAAKKAAKAAKRLALLSVGGASVSADRTADLRSADVSASGGAPDLFCEGCPGTAPEALPSVTEESADLQITELRPPEDATILLSPEKGESTEAKTERVEGSVSARAPLLEVLQELPLQIPLPQRTLSPEDWPPLPSPSPRPPVRLSLSVQKQKQPSQKQTQKQKQKRRAPKAKPHPFPLSLPPLQICRDSPLQITLRSVF